MAAVVIVIAIVVVVVVVIVVVVSALVMIDLLFSNTETQSEISMTVVQRTKNCKLPAHLSHALLSLHTHTQHTIHILTISLHTHNTQNTHPLMVISLHNPGLKPEPESEPSYF